MIGDSLLNLGWVLAFAFAFMAGGALLSGFASIVERLVERRAKRIRGER